MAGRPTKYSPELNARVDEYLALCVDEESTFHKTQGEKSDTYDRLLHVKLPTIEGFAQYIDVNKTTLYEWDKKYPEFSNSLEKIKTEQYNRLVNKGLSGDYNSTIAKLILSSNHGMSEKTETESKVTMEVSNLSELSDDELFNLTVTSESGTSQEGTSEKAS